MRSWSTSHSDLSLGVVPSIHRAPILDGENLEQLKPEDIIDLLVEELVLWLVRVTKSNFYSRWIGGFHATLPSWSVDTSQINYGALTSLKGVIHLTTHRLTFHASLLATNHDAADSEVIKTSAAILHRKSWHGKRRIWLVLSNDILCTYASSKEEDKSRPLCALLRISV